MGRWVGTHPTETFTGGENGRVGGGGRFGREIRVNHLKSPGKADVGIASVLRRYFVGVFCGAGRRDQRNGRFVTGPGAGGRELVRMAG